MNTIRQSFPINIKGKLSTPFSSESLKFLLERGSVCVSFIILILKPYTY